MKKWLAIPLLAGIVVAAYLAFLAKGPVSRDLRLLCWLPELKHSERSVET